MHTGRTTYWNCQRARFEAAQSSGPENFIRRSQDRLYVASMLNVGIFGRHIRRFCTSALPTDSLPGTIIHSSIRKNAPVQKKLNWLLLFPLAVSFGAWNLYRQGVEQEEQFEKRRANVQLPPVALPWKPSQAELTDLDHRLVFVSGELLHERELRVYPRYFESQMGMYVFTPLRRPDGSIVIINRGWVPAPLQDPSTRMESQVTDKVTILGHLVGGDDPFPFKFFSETPFFQVVNSPERNMWPRVDVEEMASWVNASPILISALANPPNPGGYPIGGQTDFMLENTLITQSYQYAALAATMVAAIYGARYVHRLGIRLPWQKKPPPYTPFTI